MAVYYQSCCVVKPIRRVIFASIGTAKQYLKSNQNNMMEGRNDPLAIEGEYDNNPVYNPGKAVTFKPLRTAEL
ncbi:hypothetical protein [Methyloglobulus sp.]|uniref:hypothetical protein n=1 Tax=Methyloglobulus sp. TaxID=2518622 RepID=UPI003988B216